MESANHSNVSKILIGIFVFVIIVWTINVSRNNASVEKEQREVQQKKIESEQYIIEQTKVAYDITKLLGKNVDQIINILGKPKGWTEATPLQISSGVKEWDNEFNVNNLNILVTYNIRTRKVIDLFLSSKDGTYKYLLKMGNLSENNPSYIIKPVQNLNDKSKYTGIIVKVN